MIFVIMGAPGAGKGTQARNLERDFGFRSLSTGDILRRHIREKTKIGREIKEVLESGRLVPDSILKGIVFDELALAEEKGETVILDGYPRNLSQAKELQALELAGVIHIDVAFEEVVKRIAGRRLCGKCHASYNVNFAPPKTPDVCDSCAGRLITREDDQEDKVRRRLEIFESETAPVLDFYRAKGQYFRIDGDQEEENVFEAIRDTVAERMHSLQ